MKRELLALKKEIDSAIALEFSEKIQKAKLFDAASYALLSGGKRVRPIIVHLIAKALGNGLPVMEAAIATEFFHTASLIADDLPCMDDDLVRRSRPSLHVEFGEGIALLSSYGLIAEAFGKIEKNGRAMRGERDPFSSRAFEATSIALEYASRFSGMRGASLGQFFDLYRNNKDLEELEEVIYLKTITLFEGAFILGWLFGGGDFSSVKSVEKLAWHFGMAFQIADDIKDFEQDAHKESSANYAVIVGMDAAKERLDREAEAFSKTLKMLSIESKEFNYLLSRLMGPK